MTKKQKKEIIQRSWGLTVDGNIPIILVSNIDDHIISIISQVIDGIVAIGLQIVFVDSKNSSCHQTCIDWSRLYSDSVKIISSEDSKMNVFDMVILEELKDSDLQNLNQKNRVPIAEKGLIESFDPVHERGNGFQFSPDNSWSLFAALVRAAETYRFPYDWNTVIRSLINSKPVSA